MRTIFLTLVTAICLSGFGQTSIENYVKTQVNVIKSVSIGSEDFDDLDAIGNAIGDARVVSLGEQDHGDAPAFEAKARLIRYLHEKKGFDVIAFESDFYGLLYAQEEALRKNESPMKLMQENIFKIWTGCSECSDVFKYIDSVYRSSSPIYVTGFDNQVHGSYRVRNYPADMKRLLQDAGSRFTEQILPLFTYVSKRYPLYSGKAIPADSLAYFDGLLDSINVEIRELPDSSLVKIMMRSIKAYTLQHIYSAANSYQSLETRDKQMAENFLWLYRHKYQGKKIIIWAHNYHIAKSTFDAFPSAKYGRHYSMGDHLGKTLKDTMYVLGFTSFKGRAGRISVKPFKVAKPRRNSIESWIASKDPAFAFIDFKGYRQLNSAGRPLFFMKGKRHKNAEAYWTEVFDGIFYIRNMFACKRK